MRATGATRNPRHEGQRRGLPRLAATVVNLGCHRRFQDPGGVVFPGGARGTRTPDPLLAKYMQTDRDRVRRALTSSLCSAQTGKVQHGCYRKQLQRPGILLDPWELLDIGMRQRHGRPQAGIAQALLQDGAAVRFGMQRYLSCSVPICEGLGDCSEHEGYPEIW
jgi:hypothetical protein